MAVGTAAVAFGAGVEFCAGVVLSELGVRRGSAESVFGELVVRGVIRTGSWCASRGTLLPTFRSRQFGGLPVYPEGHFGLLPGLHDFVVAQPPRGV